MRNFWAPLKICLVAVSLSFPCGGHCQIKASVSTNYTEYLENLPYEAERPIAREIRYIFGSALELNGKAQNPFIVTDEAKDYAMQTTLGTSWSEILNYQAASLANTGKDFFDKYGDEMTARETEAYLSMNRRVQSSIAALQIYLSAMNALAAWAISMAEKDAKKLVSWTEIRTKCISNEAPEGSILHLEIMWLVKGKRFKFHSESDFMVNATLETGDGQMITSQQIMQMWVDTKKVTVSPEDSLPMYENLTEDKRELLSPLIEKNGTLPLQALLINAAVEDLYLRVEALDELNDHKE